MLQPSSPMSDPEDLHLLGISPQRPFYDLCLAQAAEADSGEIQPNAPTFSAPVSQPPPLDSTEQMGELYRPDPFRGDPPLPNLLQPDHPYGLQFYELDPTDMAYGASAPLRKEPGGPY